MNLLRCIFIIKNYSLSFSFLHNLHYHLDPLLLLHLLLLVHFLFMLFLVLPSRLLLSGQDGTLCEFSIYFIIYTQSNIEKAVLRRSHLLSETGTTKPQALGIYIPNTPAPWKAVVRELTERPTVSTQTKNRQQQERYHPEQTLNIYLYTPIYIYIFQLYLFTFSLLFSFHYNNRFKFTLTNYFMFIYTDYPSIKHLRPSTNHFSGKLC